MSDRTHARRDNGNDGKLGLPYWDWLREDINGEVGPGGYYAEYRFH